MPNLIHESRKTTEDTYTTIIRRGYFTEYFKFAKRYDEKGHTGLQEKALLHIRTVTTPTPVQATKKL